MLIKTEFWVKIIQRFKTNEASFNCSNPPKKVEFLGVETVYRTF